MWPDEQDASSSSHSTSPIPSPRSSLINCNGGEESLPSRPIHVTRMAYYPIVLSRQLEHMHTDLQLQESLDREKSTALVAISNANLLTQQIECNKCTIKEAENRHLRKRVQELEEQLCRALGTAKKTKVLQEPVITTVKPQHVQIQPLRQVSYATAVKPISNKSCNNTDVTSAMKVHVVESQQRSTTSASNKIEDDNIELVPGSNVFISTQRLQQILTVVKTGKQLARKLMSVYWDRMVLAKSTLSAASQHYEQLDPKIISAIKTYCVLFDASARKSEIHSTMIDKCVQARRPRRSSLKQQEQREFQEVVQVSPPFLVSHQGNVQHLERKDSSIIVNEDMYHDKSRLGVQMDKCTEIVHVSSPYLVDSGQPQNEPDDKHNLAENDDDDDTGDELVIQQQQ